MNDPLRLELTGKNAKVWDSIFEKLTGGIERAIEAISSDGRGTHPDASNLVRDLATISKGWAKAKLDAPSLENEKRIAEIVAAYEEAKLTRAKREGQEIANEESRIALCEKRLVTALKWLNFLQLRVSRSPDGDLFLVVTNEDVSTLLANIDGLAEAETDS